MSYAIYHDLVINAFQQEVFDAVSLPEHLNNWWTLKCTGSPEKGNEYNLYFAPGYDWLAEVVTSTSNSFHLKMTRAMPDWELTTFGFDLETESSSTRVKFSHRNWPKLNKEFRNSSYCWALLLNGLKNYVEKGAIVPFDERS